MRRLCDLHTHSTASDGKLSPRELIELADARRMVAVALTDHDTTAGVKSAAVAAEQFDELTFIAGIELSAACGDGSVHLLGYHIDPASESLGRVAAGLRSARDRRNPAIIAKLQALGIDITLDDVITAMARESDPAVVGRPHIAAALVAKGYVRTVAEAFNQYLRWGAAAFVERDRPTAAAAIDAIHSAGGVAVWAHPVHLGFTNFAQCERVARSLVAKGLDGIEAYHGDHDAVQTRFFLDLARRLSLVVTGGSDYHGPPRPDARLGRPRVPVSVLAPLEERATERRTTKVTKNTKTTKTAE